MFVDQGRVIYSASDLAAAARCEYALLRSFDHKLGRGPRPDVSDDQLLARTADLGGAHEQRRLDELRTRHDDVAIIGTPAFTVAGLTAAAEATRLAVDAWTPVVYQAAMFDGRFVGFADFLLREDDRYRVCDTKLARSAKVPALLQVAAYADALAASGVPVAPEAELLLGNGSTAQYRTEELVAVYRRRRAALQALLDAHYGRDAAVRWDDEHVRACFRCPECELQLHATDDLLLVARMRVSQRARLLDAGVTTMAALAEHRSEVPELPTRTVTALTGQARLQVAQNRTGTAQFEVVNPQPLMLLPEPDDGDLFFDFEGDPLWTADGTDWGLEYLFGVLEAGSAEKFRPLWAHDRASERRALTRFLAMVAKRRKRHPNMHIYHYGDYEKSALLRLAGRYGVGEDEVDDLLRNGVLIDLYPLVLKSIRSGSHNYSLKSLEPLYMGKRLRTGDVTTATASIAQYATYCERRDDGRADEAKAVLDEIADYNLYDCVSTRELRTWLLLQAFEAGIGPAGALPVADEDEAVDEPDDCDRALCAFAGDGTGKRSTAQTAVAMIAAARGFHRREHKPFWWAHFNRLNYPVEEWADTSGVFVADQAAVVADWHTPARARKPQRRVRLSGQLARGDLNSKVYALYDPPAPHGLAEDSQHRGAGSADVVSADDENVPTEIVIVERTPPGGGEFDQLPFALTPGPPISTKSLQAAVERTATDIAAGLPELPPTAVVDVLLRRDPRTRSGGTLPRTGDAATDISAAVLDLDSSYLAVHGPPGTGKTHTAAAVIAKLVNEHQWRVGVVAQSHAVVEHLFDGVIAAGVSAERVAKKRSGGEGAWQVIDEKEYPGFVAGHAGCVVGGTAWDFANPGRILPGSLDLLVVEEAGQFCLANTIAVAGAAKNLLLLGDPQQLPQVSQGIHPEAVDESALGWLVDGHRTLPAQRGYFLDRSYRMHPQVCARVSALSYENRLRAADHVTAARRLDGVTPGVHTVLVDHDGNATSSPEEAAAIADAVAALIGSAWTDERGTRPFAAADALVVAPYNAQVLVVREHLKAAGLAEVPVGTVDKFQGRQAAVVFVSMTASSIDDVPRGISFLLNRNRLNVAISRAKYASVIVRSRSLTEYLPGSPAGLIDLGAFLALSPCATAAR